MAHIVAGWLVDTHTNIQAHWLVDIRTGIQAHITNLLRRLYIVQLAWRGVRQAQQAGMDVVAIGVMRDSVTVWTREHPIGPGVEFRL